MSGAAEYVLTAERDKSTAQQIAQRTAEKLGSNQLSLIEVVKSVGDYINDEDAKIRGRAVSYLTSILTELHPKYLSRQQIQVLCQFFCDRIEDGGATEGLVHLQSLERFNVEMVQMTARAILEHFQDFQRRPQSSRYQILQLVNALLSTHRKALLGVGEDFLVGFTDLISGEKDPRNLMLIFSMLRVLMVEWDITNHVERMFDSVYAYFPITFRPPPNDPHGVTAQDLKDRLRDCIASTKLLSPYAIPNLLDKLDSTSVVTKKDVLRTLTACAATYDRHTMAQYSITLWDSLKFEILNAQEPDLADETLQTLKAIAVCLSKDQTDLPSTSPLAQYLRPIAKECNEHLQEPTNRQAKAAGDILGRLCVANILTQSYLVKSVVPPLLTLYQDVGTIPKQRAILEILNTLLHSAIEMFGTWGSREIMPSTEGSFEKFKDQLFQLYSQALMSTIREELSFRCVSAKGLLELSKIRGLLEENEIGLVVHHLDDIILNEDHHGENSLKQIAMESLAEISKYKPRLIMDITFPAFMARLPDSDAEAEESKTYVTVLEGLAEISMEKEPFETLVRRLLNKIDTLISSGRPDHSAYIRAILSTILFIMERQEMTDSSSLSSYFDRVTAGFIRSALLPRAQSGSLSVLNHQSVLGVLGQLSNLIVRNLPQEKQDDIVEDIYRLFTPELDGANSIPMPKDSAYGEKIVLSTYLLAALRPNVKDPLLEAPMIQNHLEQLRDLALYEEDSVLRSMLLRQVALYVNKHLKTENIQIATSMLASLYQTIKALPDPANSIAKNPETTQIDTNMTSSPFNSSSLPSTNAIRLIFTLTKALTDRLAPSIATDLVNLFDLLNLPDPMLSSLAAHGFSTLLPLDPILSGKNYYRSRLLVPQRVLSILLPGISNGIRAASTSKSPQGHNNQMIKQNYLTALACLLPDLPPQILLPYLDQLIPLLLQCLTSTDNPSAPLFTLTSLLPPAGSSLATSGHLPSLITRLLSLTHPPRPSRVRELATKTLGMLPVYLREDDGEKELVKEKAKVVRELVGVLDDRRRDVRKEAVAARNAWEKMVGAEVEEVEEDEDGE